MSAEDFLQRVEQTGMVSEPLLIELRKRVGETHRQMRPEMLAKLLVDRGELTPAQARKLVADTKEGGGPPPLPTDDDAPAPQVPVPPAAYIEDEPEEELRLVTDDDGADEPEAEVDLSGGMGVDLGDDLLADVPPPPTSASAGDDELTLAPNMDDDELGLAPEEEVAEGILLDEEDNDLEIVPVAEPATEPETGIEPVANEASHSGPILDDILADPLATQDKVVIRRRRSMFRTITDLFPGGGNRNRKKRWDSPLILLGGAALVLLIAAGFALVGLFYGESADEIFTAGMDAYESQSYSAAIKNFDKFERQFSTHDKASLARVRVQLANLRMLTDKPTPDWEAALSQADISLNAAKVEEAFPEVRSELAKLLPDISAGLVGVAKGAETTDQKQAAIDLAVNSLTLVDNPEYLPTSVRKPQEIRIEEIQSEIAVVRRDIERERALSKTIGEIATATESGKIADAYRLRDKLVTTYPLLLDDVSLGDAIGAVTEKEKEAVKVGVSELKPTTQDHPPVSRVSVVLSDQRGSALDGLGNRVVGVLVRGAVYGLKASNGQTLWRRHVGWECSVFPQEIRGDGSGDLLLVDAAHGELQRVHADNGKLVWRLPCPKPLSTPRIEGGKAYVCCGSGPESRLLSVDLKGGSVSAEARFPVGCSTPPTIISERGEVIQPGTHSSVYVLEAGSLKCKRVFASRHARDSIVAPATWIGSSLLLAENNGTSAATLHTFTPVGEDDAWRRDAAPLKTAGQVVAWPAVNDRRVVIVTDLGEIRVLEAPLEGNGLREIASIGDSGKSVGASWPLLDRARLWLANDTFTQYELQSTRGQLVTRWSRDRSDRFLNPIQRVGDYLVHVRRRRGMSGATVAAAPVNSPDGAPVWETDIGVPGSVVIGSGGKVHAVTKNGAMFPVDGRAVSSGVTSARSSRVDPRLIQSAFSQQIKVGGNRQIFASPAPIKHAVRADLDAGRLERIPLRLSGDTVTSPLVNFGDSLLGASSAGPIYLLGPTDGKQQVEPFMPRTAPRSEIDWLAPAPVGTKQFVAADKSGKLYRVSVGDSRMALAREAAWERGSLVAGLAAAGSTVYAGVRMSDGDQIVAIDAGELRGKKESPVSGTLTWGPKSIGNLVLATDSNRTLYAFDASGTLRWQLDNAPVPLSGDPLRSGDKLVITSTAGEVATLDAKGKVLGREKFGEPFGSGPVAYRGKLLVAGWDGTLFLVNVPQ